MRTITFNELRKIKDSLPSGSMHRIADELGLHVDTVRNFFGGIGLSGNDFLTFIMDLRVKAWKEASPANADG